MARANDKIMKIYGDAIREIKKFKRDYNKVLEDFIKKLEEHKIQKIKRNIKS